MHLLMIIFKDRQIEFIGPFPTYFRANEYANAALEADGHKIERTAICPLIVPYSVVQQVSWR